MDNGVGVPDDLDLQETYMQNKLRKIDEDDNDIYGSINNTSRTKMLRQKEAAKGGLKAPDKGKQFDDKRSQGSKLDAGKKKPKHVVTGGIGGKTEMTAVGSAQDAKQKLMAQNSN
jgi:hypothetical protein